MSQYTVPLDDMRFVLHAMLDTTSHLRQVPGGEEVDRDLVDSILDEAARFAEGVVAPLNRVGDEVGCRWDDGEVIAPPGFKEAYHQYSENGWPSLSQGVDFGGQGLPGSLSFLVNEMIASACHSFVMYGGLSGGCMTTLMHHGTEEQQAMFLPGLVEGRWSGTMCLTEAHCGSDLGLLRTQAVPNDDGSYRITGTKIFISAGEHDLTENIVHVVLARLPDAPAGTRGISMFLVPKFKINTDGSLGERNGVHCASIEEKMGIHGNATCVLNFDDAEGTLIGPPNRGLNCMFTFINESRLGVAQQALAHIERAYQGSLAYAKDRLQMRSPTRRDASKPADPIIVHPDVRRMILTQKAFSEGARVLLYDCQQLVDLELRAEDKAARERAGHALSLLTPIAKGFLTEVGMEAANYGIQVFGGHGYIAEHGMEQIVRDQRITALYEGTTGIQAVDLLVRKILGTSRALLDPYLAMIRAVTQSDHGPQVGPLAVALDQYVMLWDEVTDEVMTASKENPDEAGAAAYDYLMMAGYITVGFMWLRAAITVVENPHQASMTDAFAEAKLKTAQFYFARLLPRAQQHAACIRTGADNLMAIADEMI